MQTYSVSQKSSLPSPKKLFAILLLLVNLCSWKFLWLLPNHFLHVYQFWSIYLSIYTNSITFTSMNPKFWQFNSVYYEIHEISSKKASRITWHLPKYNCQFLQRELSHYIFKISIIG